MYLVKMHFSVLVLLCFLRPSRQGNSLLGVNLNLDPVLGLVSGNTKETTTTRRSISTSDRFAPEVVTCGKRKIHHTGLITGGQPTKPGDWPWHVALYRTKTSGSQQQYICGGSLLTTSRVLTAGHCVTANGAVIVPERVFAYFGKYNLAGGDVGSQERGIYEIVVHPEFSHTTLENDIAVLKLSSQVRYSEYVQPICLWNRNNIDKNDIVNKRGTVIGWGFTDEDALSNELLKAEMPVIPDVKCIKSNPLFYTNFVTDKTFCAGFANGTSTCNGDSGGGMFFSKRKSDGSDVWYLRGLVSLGVSRADKNICDPTQYTIFTDVAQYLDFVENHVNF